MQKVHRVSLLEENEATAYEVFLDQCIPCSVQSSLDWRNVICALGKDEPYFVVAKEGDKIVGVLPLYFLKNKLGNLLTTNAWHTMSGVVCFKDQAKNICKSILEYSLALARDLDCTILSIGTNPFHDYNDYYLGVLRPDYVMENFVQYIRMKEIFDEKSNLMHPNYVSRTNLSRNLAKAKSQPLVISDEQTDENVAQCFKLHEKRMKELGAEPIPKRFFESVLKNLTSRGKGKFLSVRYEDNMVGTCLFLNSKTMMDAYMLSMDSKFARLGTNFLLTYYMLRGARENNINVFNWMSSPRKGDGVYKWKEQWGSHEGTCFYFTRVLGDISKLQQADYSELSSAYEFHYLLPFNLLNNPGVKFTTKDELTSFVQSRTQHPHFGSLGMLTYKKTEIKDRQAIEDFVKENVRRFAQRFYLNPLFDEKAIAEYTVREILERMQNGIALWACTESARKGLSIVTKSDWDSEILEKKVGKISLYTLLSPGETRQFLQETYSALRETDFDFLFGRVPMESTKEALPALLTDNAILGDILITLGKNIYEEKSLQEVDLARRADLVFRTGKITDEEQLQKITFSAYKHSHYFNDPKIPVKRAEAIYQQWIKNSLKGFADCVMVAEVAKEIVGYITLRTENLGERAFGVIDLIAVRESYRGQGIAKMLVAEGIKQLQGRVDTLYVSTQASNLPALELYHVLRFERILTEATFHVWLKT